MENKKENNISDNKDKEQKQIIGIKNENEKEKDIKEDNKDDNQKKEEEKEKDKNKKEDEKISENNNKEINLQQKIEERKKEKERKKQEKQQKKLLSKKHKSPEDLEYEKIFEDNNKILINFLGDSITEGLKWQKKEVYCFYLSKWLNIKVNNQGYRATRIARQDDDDKDFNYRLKSLDEKADFTFIFGGTNDYSMGEAEIGDINSDSYYTFYGAVKNLVNNLLKKFSHDKICFILPLSRFNEDKIITHAPLSKYRDIIKEICNLNKIDYLDLCKELPIPDTDGKTEFFKDGLHPNKQGHKAIARNIIKYLKNKGIINKNFEPKE
jgi:lysophospholipase L1-like esterase